jgi:putative transcriptional regulator
MVPALSKVHRTCHLPVGLRFSYARFMVQGTFLQGKILIAMPAMADANFGHALVLLCAHSDQGAMGLILNKPAPLMSFADLLDEIKIGANRDTVDEEVLGTTVRLGGPVEQFRGFVLHSQDYRGDDTTLKVDGGFKLTVSMDVLRDIAEGKGPERMMIALGYAGWSPGQLENEMQRNGWLFCDADEDLIFDGDLSTKYERALAKIGVDPGMLSSDVGHA